MKTKRRDRQRSAEAGFTLVEALTAVLILVFGLIGVTNLMMVATTTNSVATQMTSAADHAVEVMERLKAISFEQFSTDLACAGCSAVTATYWDSDQGAAPGCIDDTPANNCVRPGNFNAHRNIPGVGHIVTRWSISTAGSNRTLFIRVRSEGTGALIGARSRAEFTTFRTCTADSRGCGQP